MSRVDVQRYRAPDDVTLVADVGGPAGAPTVIMLHGGGQTRHAWSGSMRALIGRGYRVISYDARGHGDSDWSPSGEYGLEAQVRDLRAIRDTVQGPVALVGASMGGMTAFYAAGTNPATIAQAVVLVDIVLEPARSGVDHIQRFMTANLAGFASLDDAAEAVAAYNPDRPRPRNPSGLLKNLRRRDDGRLYWHWDPRLLEMEPSVEPPQHVQQLIRVAPMVKLPVLVIRGERSDVVTDEGIEQMRRLVPHMDYRSVAGAGHMVAGDRNTAFTDGIFAFLDKHLPLQAGSGAAGAVHR